MDGAGAKASRLLWRKLSPFPGAMGLPADASGAYRPNPQATKKLAPRPSSLKGYGKISKGKISGRNRRAADPDRVLREAVQEDGIFLRCPFFCRRAPHSEAFFRSVIQIVSGIRYEDAAFFF